MTNRLLRALRCTLLLMPLLAAGSASATEVRVGLGADYWINRTGLFNLTLAVDGNIARNVALGGRFGALITSGPSMVGVPIDVFLRATLGDRVYLEGMAGPWVLVTTYPVRAHVAFGFGFQASWVAIGLELGWLDPSAIVGVRLAFRI